MEQFYANVSQSGLLEYYTDAVHTPEQIPATAIEITEEQWKDCIANQGKWTIVEGVLALAPAPDPSYLLAVAQSSKKSELSNSVGAKIVAGYLYPIAIASTGLTYLYGTEVIDQQNMTASRVWSDNNPTLPVKYRPSGGVGRIEHTRDEFIAVSDAIFTRVNWYLDQVDVYLPQIYAADATADSVNAIVIVIADPA